MYRLQCLLLCFFACYAIGDTSAVSFIKPCKPDDAACQKASAIAAIVPFAAGVPEIGLPPADLVTIDSVEAGDKDVKISFKNLKIIGINKCSIVDFSRDVGKSTMNLVVDCPITATGQYNLNGKLLFIPAEGNGDFVIKMGKANFDVVLKVKVVENAGKKHWKITGFDYNYDIKEKSSISLENLFGGDETRAKPLREVLENSSNELIKELGGPIIKEVLTKTVDMVQKFLKVVPISDLELS